MKIKKKGEGLSALGKNIISLALTRKKGEILKSDWKER